MFDLYALDTKLDVKPSADGFETRANVMKAIQGHILAKAVHGACSDGRSNHQEIQNPKSGSGDSLRLSTSRPMPSKLPPTRRKGSSRRAT